jgi:hypothetical protein
MKRFGLIAMVVCVVALCAAPQEVEARPHLARKAFQAFRNREHKPLLRVCAAVGRGAKKAGKGVAVAARWVVVGPRD